MVKKALRTAASQVWATDHGLSVFLLALVIVAFVLPPLVPLGRPGRFLADAFFSLLLVSGAAGVWSRKRERAIVLAVALVTLCVRWLSWFYPTSALLLAREWATLATLGMFTAIVLAQVLKGGTVNRQRIEGAIAAYILLGLVWATAYELVYMMIAGSFAGAIAPENLNVSFGYYSFVALTTVGFGDITAVHPIARSLTVLESLTGQLYVAILLARLVSLELQQKR